MLINENYECPMLTIFIVNDSLWEEMKGSEEDRQRELNSMNPGQRWELEINEIFDEIKRDIQSEIKRRIKNPLEI